MDNGLAHSRQMDAEHLPWRRDQHRRLMADLDKVLPFVGRDRDRPREDSDDWSAAAPTRRDWAEALDLVHEAAETVRASEARLKDVTQQATDELQGLRARVIAAEARAEEAELRLRELEPAYRDLDKRARETENRLRIAEERATEAETRAREAQMRVNEQAVALSAAEARAAEAESWLERVHNALVNEFLPRRRREKEAAALSA